MVYPTSKMNTAAKVRINFELANKPIGNLHIKQLFYDYFNFIGQILIKREKTN